MSLGLAPSFSRGFFVNWWLTLDKALLVTMLTLAAIGIGLVISASPAVAVRIGAPSDHFIIRHVMFLIPALGLMIACSMLSPQQVWRVASILGGIAILGVVMTHIHGVEIKGGKRWIQMFGFSIQPSEFLKPCFIVIAGWLLARQKTSENFKGGWIALGLYALVVALLITQPDFGMTAVVTVSFMGMLVLWGLRLRWFVVLTGLAMLGAALAYLTLGHVQDRVNRFLDPSSGDNYQIERSLEAFTEGGLFGVGVGEGKIKRQLPDAHADFVFSVFGEEMGMIFTLGLVALYGFLVVRGFLRLMQGNSVFAMIAGGGLLFMIGLQALIHMGSATRLLPAKGMTLPLLSYGGSSLVAIGMTMGIILALTKLTGNERRDGFWHATTRENF